MSEDGIEGPTRARQHFGHTLSYVVNGEAELELGRLVRAHVGCLIMIPAGTPHRPVRKLALEAWCLRFCPSCLVNDGDWLQPFSAVRQGASPVVPVPAARQSKLTTLFEGLDEELERGEPHSSALAESWLRLILGELRRAAPHTRDGGPSGSLS